MTPAEFKTRFPEFASESDSRVQFYIDGSTPFFDVCRWDDLYSVGVAYFVAHEIMMANARVANGSAVDDETGVTAGELSVTRSAQLVIMQAQNEYLKTIYGQKYLKFSKMVGQGGVAL